MSTFESNTELSKSCKIDFIVVLGTVSRYASLPISDLPDLGFNLS